MGRVVVDHALVLMVVALNCANVRFNNGMLCKFSKGKRKKKF